MIESMIQYRLMKNVPGADMDQDNFGVLCNGSPPVILPGVSHFVCLAHKNNKNKALRFLFIELIEDCHIFSLDSYKLLHMVNRVLTII